MYLAEQLTKSCLWLRVRALLPAGFSARIRPGFKAVVALGGLAGVASSGSVAAQYLGLSERLLSQVEQAYGVEARQRVQDWKGLMVGNKQLPDDVDSPKMTSANDFFNRVNWVSDLEHWGKEDYWATPIETLATNGGDCEDFSIGKYFTLKNTGVENDKLRITYVKALDYDQAHMVLAYYPAPDAEPLILDNINKTILPASQRPDLLPIYSFNGESLWLAKARGKKLRANSLSSLPHWRGVNERMLEELAQPRSRSAEEAATPR